MTLDELKVIIKADSTNFTSTIQDVKNNLKQLKGTTKDVGKSFERNLKGNSQLSTLKSELRSLENDLRSQATTVSRAQEKLDEYTAKWKALTDPIKDINQQVKGVGLSDKAIYDSFAKTGGAIAEIYEKMQHWRGVVDSTKGSYKATEDAVNSTKNKIQEITTKLTSQSKAVKAVVAVKTAFQGLFKALGSAGRAIGTITNKLNVFSAVGKKVASTFTRLANLAKRVFFFSVFTKAFRSLRTEISNYLSTNKELTTSLGQLKGAWLTAINPIYNALIPALNTVVQLFTKVGQCVASLTSMFAGKTTQASAKSAKALYEQAAALDATNSAAQKTKTLLSGFDELNTVSSKSSSSTSIVPEFETEDAENYQSFSEWLTAMLDKLNNMLPSISDAFGKAAEKINSFFSEMYEGFSQDGILQKGIEFATGLGDAFNDLVSKVDFKTIGQAIGSGLNFIITTITEFIYSIDWTELGTKIADGLNNLFGQINFEELGKFLVSQFNVVWQTIKGFVTEFDWHELGNDISHGLNGMIQNIDLSSFVESVSTFCVGILDTIATALGNTDFSLLGSKIGEALNKIDWKNLIQNLFTALVNAVKGALDLLTGFLETFDMYGLAKGIFSGIGNAIANINWLDLFVKIIEAAWAIVKSAVELGFGIIDGLKEGIWAEIKGIANWINTHVVQPIINAFKNLFGIHSPSTVFKGLGSQLISGLLEGLKASWSTIKEFFSTALENLKTQLSAAWERISTNATEKWNKIKNTVTNGLGNAFEKLSSTAASIKNSIVNSFSSLHTTLTSKVEALKTSLSSKWTAIKNNAVNAFNSLKTDCASKLEALKTTASSITSWLSTKMSSIYNSVSNWASKIKTKISNATSGSYSNSVSLPSYATGGVVSRPTAAIIGDAGINNPEIVTPESKMREILVANNSDLVSAFAQMTKQVITAIGNVDMNVSIGDDVIAKSAARGNNSYKRMTGTALI